MALFSTHSIKPLKSEFNMPGIPFVNIQKAILKSTLFQQLTTGME
jgi:hypothetical protein